MKFSIIIPAYNFENLIEDCLQSIIWQDFPKDEYEIIIVEDCSTDDTYSRILSLIDSYHKDPELRNLNIHLIKHDVNKRQGGGRNTGLKIAKGDYVLFVDSDDYFSGDNVLKELSSIIDLDPVSLIVSKSCQSVPFDSHPKICKIPLKGEIEYCDSNEYLLSDYYCIELWKGCYNHKFLLDNNLYFRENVVFEDTDWSFKMCVKANSVALIDFPFYSYRNNPNSTTQTLPLSSRIQNIEAIIELYDFIKENETLISDGVKKKFMHRIGDSVKGSFIKSYKYRISETKRVISSIPEKLYSHEITYGFSKLDRLIFFIEHYFPLIGLSVLRTLYVLKRFSIKYKF